MNVTRVKKYAVVAAVLVCAVAVAGQKQAKAAKQDASPATASSGSSSGGANSSGISVRTENGRTTVTYKGEEVFSGQTSGMVSGRSSNVNGAEYAAAFDGDKVLWENVYGAAEKLKAEGGVNLPGVSLPGAGQPKSEKKKSAKKRRGDA